MEILITAAKESSIGSLSEPAKTTQGMGMAENQRAKMNLDVQFYERCHRDPPLQGLLHVGSHLLMTVCNRRHKDIHP